MAQVKEKVNTKRERRKKEDLNGNEKSRKKGKKRIKTKEGGEKEMLG